MLDHRTVSAFSWRQDARIIVALVSSPLRTVIKHYTDCQGGVEVELDAFRTSHQNFKAKTRVASMDSTSNRQTVQVVATFAILCSLE